MLVPEELAVVSIHSLCSCTHDNVVQQVFFGRPSQSQRCGLCLAEGGSPDVGLAQCACRIMMRIAVPALQRHISLDGLCLMEGTPERRHACALQDLERSWCLSQLDFRLHV